ncbi:PH and SEC7 domain-containing protein 4 [Oryzias latipes]|uniref:Pleckstrin and Sec7 domain containing 4 n=1 Tax=Oryzias latipes TaxID=8090 RepID=H2LSI6_ORYLA|nr:PH and SEC7 domain-containing protein 4 [Oryzias latipes]XP_011480069.1 PH and SEC7 domain-containing protein 4 [Oryzias latipes]XP_011480071.1 PH and SEC7 domain-containing protein 4 [Oryzias latipes]XP_020563309.1 PH and SEC7 domain-containing protein 4 [Oryzias latipes]XP_020563311.1 PH and SEC7 domain-containing protein 4 [Oryzias latipes]XP_023816648.1 PH and SEC7 domain-containing protein 4 [Oryzias latipes]XP_023816649.1 PH and SEC7 domain-containing protein 4 [Oryzias latipes]
MNEESGLVEVPPHTDECEQLEQQEEQDVELRNQLTQSENQQHLEETVGVDPQGTEEVEKMQPVEETLDLPTQMCSERPEQPEQPEQPERTSESELKEQLSPEPEVTQQIQIQDVILKQADTTVGESHQAEESEVTDNEDVKKPEANGEQHKAPGSAFKNGKVDKAMARSLAERLFNLDRIQRADVVKHLDKDNDFSHAVGEEYLQFFDFTGQTLDQALRSFLKVVLLIGESQERERVLQHFSSRFLQCNPSTYSSSGSVLALTCALMLLNTDLHGQHVGKPMSSSKFVSNLDGMNEGGNFNKDLLKSFYNSIKNEPLEWAVNEEELKNSVMLDESAGESAPLRSKANPFQDVPQDKRASVVVQGFLKRKLHADIDGKRTPWGKRGWKAFYGVLKGMVLYLQKGQDNSRGDDNAFEEVVSVHHSLAEQAADYSKSPHVFRLQTADWRVFLFKASSTVEMNSWISRINLVSALHSSPPFPAAVGSQRRFCRPILPVSQSVQTLECQLQSHTGMLESFKADLSHQQENAPEGKKAKAKDLEEHRVRTEYLHHEVCRYEIYIQVLQAWKKVKTSDQSELSISELNQFDRCVCGDSVDDKKDEESELQRSHSSPSLEVELAPPTVIKVRRNISERRPYRKTIVPRRTKEA